MKHFQYYFIFLDGCAFGSNEELFWINGPKCEKPKKSTGGGDNFNAGFCLGWLNDLSWGDCVALAVCTSGFYVRNTFSPNIVQLSTFMKEWAQS